MYCKFYKTIFFWVAFYSNIIFFSGGLQYLINTVPNNARNTESNESYAVTLIVNSVLTVGYYVILQN
jgi:hypothetical protein